MELDGALQNIMKPYEALWSLVEAYGTLYRAIDHLMILEALKFCWIDNFM